LPILAMRPESPAINSSPSLR